MKYDYSSLKLKHSLLIDSENMAPFSGVMWLKTFKWVEALYHAKIIIQSKDKISSIYDQHYIWSKGKMYHSYRHE